MSDEQQVRSDDEDYWHRELSWRDALWLIPLAILFLTGPILKRSLDGLPWWGQIGLGAVVAGAAMYWQLWRQRQSCPVEERGSPWQPVPAVMVIAAIIGVLFWLLYRLGDRFFARYAVVLVAAIMLLQAIILWGLRHLAKQRRTGTKD